MGDNTDGQLTDAMSEVAAALGVSAADCPDLAREILFENSVSSALPSRYKARMNVTPVAPVELACAIAEVILTLEEQDPAELTSVDGVSEIAQGLWTACPRWGRNRGSVVWPRIANRGRSLPPLCPVKTPAIGPA